MSSGWSGPDPVAQTEPGIDYELGTRYLANQDVTITKVRVWNGGTSAALAGRKGRIWSAAGALLGEANLPNSLSAGWNSYNLVSPVDITAGNSFWVTYSTITNYGALVPGGYPRNSVDGLVTANLGGFHGTPGTFPNTTGTTFYGIDVEYDPTGAAGRPAVGIAVTQADMVASATLTIEDETPALCTYVIEWGDGNESAVGTLGPHLHTYVTPGTYVVLVTATDPDGLTDAAATTVTVAPPFDGMNIADVMDAVAGRLDTIPGLRCFAYPPGSVTPPAAVVSYPDSFDPHGTYNRGMARMKLPVVVVVGKVSDRSARDRLSAYAAVDGAESIVRVLDSGTYTAFDVVTVTGIEFDVVRIGGTDYIAAVLDLDIVGRGSA